MQWPDYFPDDCPPQDAQPATGDVYRLVKQNPPESRDFIPLREKKLMKILVRKNVKFVVFQFLDALRMLYEMRNRERGMEKPARSKRNTKS